MHVVIKKMNLITYDCGASYDPQLFNPISNTLMNKPKGGLWSSPIDCTWGWKDWCEAESYSSLAVHFTFQVQGQILVIDSLDDAKQMPWKAWTGQLPMQYPDFEKILTTGVDAIHLTDRGQDQTRFSDPSLYGWDCECVLILNPSSIFLGALL